MCVCVCVCVLRREGKGKWEHPNSNPSPPLLPPLLTPYPRPTACAEHTVRPSLETFSLISEMSTRAHAQLYAMPLLPNTLSALVRYTQLAAPHGTLLVSLVLSDCSLDDSSGPALKALLLASRHLQSFSASENSIGDEGCSEISEGLFQLATLQQLDLSGNCVGDLGFASLVTSIATCANLSHFEVSRNNLTAASVRPLTSRLATHKNVLTHIGTFVTPCHATPRCIMLHRTFCSGYKVFSLTRALLQTLPLSRASLRLCGCAVRCSVRICENACTAH